MLSILADTVYGGYCGPLVALTVDVMSLLGQLPDEWNSLRRLLKVLGSAFEEYEKNEETLGLSGMKRSSALMKLLHHLFGRYQEVTGRLVVFCM